MNEIGVWVAATLRLAQNRRDVIRRYSSSTFGMTVHLCDDDTPKVTRLLERFTLRFSSLPNARIKNHNR